MKKTLQIISFAAVALAALTSCAKEQFKENAIPAGEKIQVSINGQIGELTPADATRSAAGSVVRVTWEDGDKVYVYDGSSASLGSLAVTPDEDNASYALLSGTIEASSASPAPTKLTLVYVKGATVAPAIVEGKILVDLSTQDETEVPFVLYTTIDYDADKLSKTGEYMSFKFATSVMTVGCTDLQTNAGSVIGISKAEIDGVSTVCELAVTGSGVAVAGAKTGKITRIETANPSVFTQSDSRGSFKLAIAADPAAPAARNILVHQGSKVSGAPFTTATLAGGKSYNTVYQLSEYALTLPEGLFTVGDPDGVPDSGDETKVYFACGNLTYDVSTATWAFYEHQYDRATGYDDNLISLFTWGYSEESSVIPNGTSYVSGYENGGSSFARSEDWGYVFGGESSIWRTLTQGEWAYLFNNHARKWVNVNGVPGFVIAPDGFEGTLSESYADDAALAADKLVFLPAAGSRSANSLSFVNERGYYWSSTSFNLWHSYNLIFINSDSFTSFTQYIAREEGFSVRLVTEVSGSYAPAVKVTGVSLDTTRITIEAGAAETLVATVTPANAANKQVAWSSSDEAVATVDENGEVTGVAAGSAVITATTADGNFTAVCIVTVKPLPPTTGIAKRTGDIDVNWVQLWDGGPKFAEYNVGAANNKAEDYGGLYCWGKAIDKDQDRSCKNDGESPLSGDDDTATKLWGSNWRMPTQAELEALLNSANCTAEWTDNYNETGIKGRVFTGKGVYASNSVFLPAAGFGYGSGVNYLGSNGYYWPSTPNGNKAYYLTSIRANSTCTATATATTAALFARCLRSNGWIEV